MKTGSGSSKIYRARLKLNWGCSKLEQNTESHSKLTISIRFSATFFDFIYTSSFDCSDHTYFTWMWPTQLTENIQSANPDNLAMMMRSLFASLSYRQTPSELKRMKKKRKLEAKEQSQWLRSELESWKIARTGSKKSKREQTIFFLCFISCEGKETRKFINCMSPLNSTKSPRRRRKWKSINSNTRIESGRQEGEEEMTASLI